MKTISKKNLKDINAGIGNRTLGIGVIASFSLYGLYKFCNEHPSMANSALRIYFDSVLGIASEEDRKRKESKKDTQPYAYVESVNDVQVNNMRRNTIYV